jgi:hypothetical protein
VSTRDARETRELTVSEERWLVTSPAPHDAWREALSADPFSLETQAPGWLGSICALGGYEDASRLYERSDGRRLVLPMARRSVPGNGRLALQSSFGDGWGMGGLVGAGGVSSGDVRIVAEDLAARPALRTLIRPNPLLASAWEAAAQPGVEVIPRLSHVLDLEGGFEHVWKTRFAGGARTNVRKAEKVGIVVERGRSEKHIAAFYELFDRSLERWAGRQHEPAWLTRLRAHRRDPIRKFLHLADALGDAFGVWLASLEGRPVAAAIVLLGSNAHYTRGAMDAELAGPTRANYLLHARAIEHACDAGCRHYHFGESGSSSSLAQFKTRFGADEHPYAEYRFERLPLSSADRRLRGSVKRLIGFRDPV